VDILKLLCWAWMERVERKEKKIIINIKGRICVGGITVASGKWEFPFASFVSYCCLKFP